MTLDQLKIIAPLASKADKYLPMLNDTMTRYEINTPLRQAHFLAQVLHESGALLYTRELATGNAYEGRKDLGNTQVGDGAKFKGRGFIQLTGRANYIAYGKYIGKDLTIDPELVATVYPADVAGWFWKTRNLNVLADKDDFVGITRRVNGGTNGIDDRKAYLDRAKKAFGI